MKTNRKSARRVGVLNAVVDRLVELSGEIGNPIPATAMRQRITNWANNGGSYGGREAISVALTNMVETPLRVVEEKEPSVEELKAELAKVKAQKAKLQTRLAKR